MTLIGFSRLNFYAPLSPKGFVTMILQCSIEMPNISYAWKELKEQLGEGIDSKVRGMVFLKGKLVSVGPQLSLVVSMVTRMCPLPWSTKLWCGYHCTFLGK